ncbi:MAG TPA: MarR family transcriptional regulator [Deltaproteobacteria bacterium]|jgi:DNA-binding MarR family transcriptional regulator|nr:MarR family transcriptional regulator [Deltaproteobacteria bacterium]
MIPSGIEFGELSQLIGYQLRRAQSAIFQDFFEKIAEEGLTPGRHGLLMLIGQNAGLSQTDLASATGIDRTSMVAILDKLEAKGWVKRQRSREDRRRHQIDLTPQGKTLLKQLWPKILQHEAEVCQRLTSQEIQTLLRLLEKIY